MTPPWIILIWRAIGRELWFFGSLAILKKKIGVEMKASFCFCFFVFFLHFQGITNVKKMLVVELKVLFGFQAFLTGLFKKKLKEISKWKVVSNWKTETFRLFQNLFFPTWTIQANWQEFMKLFRVAKSAFFAKKVLTEKFHPALFGSGGVGLKLHFPGWAGVGGVIIVHG